MECNDIVNDLLSDAPLNGDVELHLERCDECRCLRDAVIACEQLGAEERMADISALTAESVLRSVRQIQEDSFRPPHTRMVDWWIMRGLAAAAVFVLLAGGAILASHYLLFGQRDAAEPEVRIDTAELTIELAQARKELAEFAVRYEGGLAQSSLFSDIHQLRNRMERTFRDLNDDFSGIN